MRTWVPAEVEGTPPHACDLLPFILPIFLLWPLSLTLNFQDDSQPTKKKKKKDSSQGIIYLTSSIVSTEAKKSFSFVVVWGFLVWFGSVSASAVSALYTNSYTDPCHGFSSDRDRLDYPETEWIDSAPLGQSISFLFPLTLGSKKGPEQSSEWSLQVNLLRECTDELEDLQKLELCGLFLMFVLFVLSVFFWGGCV